MDLAIQTETFIILLATGFLLGFIFDFYRVLRGIHKLRGITTAAGDLLYWFIATALTGSALLYSNGGEIRLYIFLALAAGALTYFKVLSRTCIRLIVYLLRAFTVVTHWCKLTLYYTVIKPLFFPVRLLARPAAHCVRKLRQWSSRFEAKDEKPPV